MTRREGVPGPSGMAPPLFADSPRGEVNLVLLAAEVVDRYAAEFPDEEADYDAGVWRAWTQHDNQHLLSWAFADVHGGLVDLLAQVAWLAGILAARDFPMDRMARDLELCAAVVAEWIGADAVAARLREAAGSVPRA